MYIIIIIKNGSHHCPSQCRSYSGGDSVALDIEVKKEGRERERREEGGLGWGVGGVKKRNEYQHSLSKIEDARAVVTDAVSPQSSLAVQRPWQ